MIYNVTFRVRDQSDLSELLNIIERNFMFIYCNQIYDEYIFEGPLLNRKNTKLLDFFDKKDVQINNPNGKIVFIYMKCNSKNQNHLQIARSIVGKNQGLIQSGYQMKNWQYYNTIIYGERQVEKLIIDLEDTFEYEILSHKELKSPDFKSKNIFVEIRDIRNKLTSLQLEVLLSCIEQDYYATPRKIHIKDIAKQMEKSRSSIQTVFRMAENRVMDVIVPQLLHYLTESRD